MLEGKHFQNAYVCDNLEAGIDLFRGRGLQKEPIIIPVDQLVDTPQGPKKQRSRICFIWIDDLQYELIEVIEDEVGVFDKCLSNGGPLRFHHVCTRIDDWAEFRARVDQQDLPVVMERDLGGDSLKFLYLDGRKLFGHFFEYVWMSDAQWQQTRAM